MGDVVVQQVEGAFPVDAVPSRITVRHHLFLHFVVRSVPRAWATQPRQSALEWQRGRVAPAPLSLLLSLLLLLLLFR